MRNSLELIELSSINKVNFSCSNPGSTIVLTGSLFCFSRGNDKCLIDNPQYQFKRSNKLPGEIYSPTMQCKLTYGKHSTVCPFRVRRNKCNSKIFTCILSPLCNFTPSVPYMKSMPSSLKVYSCSIQPLTNLQQTCSNAVLTSCY